MRTYLQRYFIRFLVKKLFRMIEWEDLLRIEPGLDKKTGRPFRTITMGGRQIDEIEASSIKRDAELFDESRIWKILSEGVKYQCGKRIFEGTNNEETLGGRMGLWVIRQIEEAIKKIKKEV
jgi:hypothetical protein